MTKSDRWLINEKSDKGSWKQISILKTTTQQCIQNKMGKIQNKNQLTCEQYKKAQIKKNHK